MGFIATSCASCSARGRLQHQTGSHRLPSRRLVLVGGGSQSQNRYSPLAHEDENEVDRNQGAIQFNVADTESVATVPEDGFDEDPAEEDEMMSGGGVDVPSEMESEVEVPFRLPGALTLRRAFAAVDGVNLVEGFDERACPVPRFLRGPHRISMRVALEEINVDDAVRQERGWKLFLLLPRMLLHRAPRGGTNPKSKLLVRFDQFNAGELLDLLEASRKANQQAAVNRRRRQVSKAEALVHMEEGSSLAPGTEATLDALRDPSKRLREPRTPVPRELSSPEPRSFFNVEEVGFSRNLRSA